MITTRFFDANIDPLPAGPGEFDAFYARSALHVREDRLTYLLHALHGALKEGGVVSIEGKHRSDPKVLRSVPVDKDNPQLVLDPFENGHLRRVWDPDYSRERLASSGFAVDELEVIKDVTVPGEPAVFTRILAIKE